MLPTLMVDITNHPDRLVSHHFIDIIANFNVSNKLGSDLTKELSLQISIILCLKQGTEFISNLICGIVLLR